MKRPLALSTRAASRRFPGLLAGSSRRRTVLALLVATFPTAALAFAGCSSDSKNGGDGAITVDPGGTYGAEIAVTVVGRGRVVTNLPGLNCPGDCFSRLVFADRNQDGASGTVMLKAIPTPGVRFAGWKFATASLGARGRGPSACNPVKRDSVSPAVDSNALEIALPYGEVNGTVPAGLENSCVGFTSVPVAYSVTATFESTIIDASPDADGGGEVFLEPPAGVAGIPAREIGILGGRIYVRYDSGGTSFLASASTSGGTLGIISNATNTYAAFEIGQNVVWHTSGGQMGVVTAGSTFAQTFSAGGNTCVAVESDFSNVYCRTAGPNGNLVSWTTNGANITTLHSGLPEGTELAVDSSSFYLTDTSGGIGAAAIRSIPRTGTPDAGVPTLTDVATNLQSSPLGLELNTSRLFWVDYDMSQNLGVVQVVSRFGTTVSTTTPSTSGLRVLGLDPNSSTAAFIGMTPSTATGASSVGKTVFGSSSITNVRQNLTGVGGVAADTSFVYWTQSDGRVYRAPRGTF